MTQTAETLAEEVQQLCEFHQITHWDYMTVSDGSGTHWEASGGWCAFLYDRARKRRLRLSGGFSRATCRIAEYMGVFQPLLFLDGTLPKQNKRERKPVVVVMSDLKALTEAFKSPQEARIGVLTSLMCYFVDRFEIHALWLPGEATAVQKECHKTGNLVRKLFLDFQ